VQRAADQVAQAAELVGPEALPEVYSLEVAVANHRGQYAEAVRRYEAAADGLRRSGLLRPLASAMLHAGIALAGRGAYVRAIALLEESATQCQQAGAEHLQARAHNTLGGIYRQLGELTQADEQHARAVELSMRTAFEEALAHAWVGRAEVALDNQDVASTRELLGLAANIVHDPLIFYSWRIAMRWRAVHARLALLEGDRDTALSRADEVLEAAATTASPKYAVVAHGLRAQALGRSGGGAEEARTAFSLARELDAPPLIVETARIVEQLTSGSEAEEAQRIAYSARDALVAALPEALGRKVLSQA
jgi:tetratricopeptide (TPR) repeat protein